MIPATIPRTALVTGGAKRLGALFARALAADGFRVAVHHNASEDEARALAAEIGGVALRADLAIEADVAGLAKAARAVLGPLGVVVNNASRFERDEATDVSRASWDAHMEANLRAPFVLIQDLARHLPDGAEGVAINLLDQRVWNLTPHFTSYTLSKAGLWTLTQTLALALAPRVRVAAIGPGPTLPSPRQTQAQFDRQVDSVPLNRGPGLDEMASALRFILATPSFTGQMLALDGGQHLNWAATAPHAEPDE
ncbi:MAG: SDR family oxidoreductase [Tagaea sp.]|nr:SDR family oxidoreductase [Tagaea sp.]